MCAIISSQILSSVLRPCTIYKVLVSGFVQAGQQSLVWMGSMEGLVAEGRIEGRGWKAGRRHKEQGAVVGHMRIDRDLLSGQNAETTCRKT